MLQLVTHGPHLMPRLAKIMHSTRWKGVSQLCRHPPCKIEHCIMWHTIEDCGCQDRATRGASRMTLNTVSR
jgi:hypothetical protein